jgi:hypothetical protein
VIINLKGITETKGVKLTIDGEPVPPEAIGVRRAVDPGDHKINVTAQGYKPASATFTIAASATQTVEVPLEKAPMAAASSEPVGPTPKEAPGDGGFPHQKAVALTALGVGGAGLIAGAVTGVFAVGRYIDLVGEGCTRGSCPASVVQSGDLSRYQQFATITSGALIGGGALATAGIVLLLLTPGPRAATKAAGVWVTPQIGLGQVGLTGRF